MSKQICVLITGPIIFPGFNLSNILSHRLKSVGIYFQPTIVLFNGNMIGSISIYFQPTIVLFDGNMIGSISIYFQPTIALFDGNMIGSISI